MQVISLDTNYWKLKLFLENIYLLIYLKTAINSMLVHKTFYEKYNFKKWKEQYHFTYFCESPICLNRRLIQASAFSLLRQAVLVEVYEENLASYRFIVGKQEQYFNRHTTSQYHHEIVLPAQRDSEFPGVLKPHCENL